MSKANGGEKYERVKKLHMSNWNNCFRYVGNKRGQSTDRDGGTG